MSTSSLSSSSGGPQRTCAVSDVAAITAIVWRRQLGEVAAMTVMVIANDSDGNCVRWRQLWWWYGIGSGGGGVLEVIVQWQGGGTGGGVVAVTVARWRRSHGSSCATAAEVALEAVS
eukprot:364384-Chlamydomonas_euryale.AAC.2